MHFSRQTDFALLSIHCLSGPGEAEERQVCASLALCRMEAGDPCLIYTQVLLIPTGNLVWKL